MTREHLLRQLRKEARRRGHSLQIDTFRGKGSHCRVRLGDKVTTIKSGELSPTYVKLVRKQLGLE